MFSRLLVFGGALAATTRPEPTPVSKLEMQIDGRKMAEMILPHIDKIVREYGLG
jgi:hypothetical protein